MGWPVTRADLLSSIRLALADTASAVDHQEYSDAELIGEIDSAMRAVQADIGLAQGQLQGDNKTIVAMGGGTYQYNLTTDSGSPTVYIMGIGLGVTGGLTGAKELNNAAGHVIRPLREYSFEQGQIYMGGGAYAKDNPNQGEPLAWWPLPQQFDQTSEAEEAVAPAFAVWPSPTADVASNFKLIVFTADIIPTLPNAPSILPLPIGADECIKNMVCSTICLYRGDTDLKKEYDEEYSKAMLRVLHTSANYRDTGQNNPVNVFMP